MKRLPEDGAGVLPRAHPPFSPLRTLIATAGKSSHESEHKAPPPNAYTWWLNDYSQEIITGLRYDAAGGRELA